MKNFNTVFDFKKVLSIILAISFLFANSSYGIDMSVRVPLLGNSPKNINRAQDALNEVKETLPEDLVEIPQKSFKLKPEREINERYAERMASIEIQKNINNFIAELSLITADSKNAETDEEKNNIAEREGMLLEGMRGLYANIPKQIISGKPYKFYSALLKELKKHRDHIYEIIKKAAKDGNKKVLAQANLEAIRNNLIILKMQVLIAGMLLSGKSTLKRAKISRYASLAALQGALNSAKRLEDELLFRIKRLKGKKRIEELETTDWIGQLVRTFRLGGFDIQVSEEGKDEPGITVRQQKWINVKTRLSSIRIDIRKGNIKKAVEELDILIKLYSVYYIITLESYREMSMELKAIRALALGLPESQAPPLDILKPIQDKIDSLSKKITHPKLRIWTEINYKNMEKAFHGKIKTIASYEIEYMLILGNKANLEYYVEKLKTASQKGYLSKRNKESIEDGISRLMDWVERGFVYPKQFSAINLRPIIGLLEAEDYNGARNFCEKAINELEVRLLEIEKIVSNVRRSAASTYSEYRDSDISERSDSILIALNAKDFESAVSQINELRELYFNQELVEPGYIRAERLLRQVTRIIRGINQVRDKELSIRRIENILNELKQDIVHKYSFKITVTREDGKSRKIFINPGTTALGLLNLKNLQRNPDTTPVSIGKGWIPKENLSKVKIPESAHVSLKPKAINSSL